MQTSEETALSAVIGWILWGQKMDPLIGSEEENITADCCDFCLFLSLNLVAV